MDYTINHILLQGLRNGETAAYNYLHETTFQSIRSLFKYSSNSKKDAEDLYNDSMILFLHKIKKKDFVIEENLQGMLYYICYFKNQNSKRKENPIEYYEGEPPNKSHDASHDENMDQDFFDKIYRRNLNKLKEDCQKILNKYFDELGSKKIAKDLGLTSENVRQKILRCKEALNKHLAKDPDYRRLQNNNEIP